ncbi:MAG TPA: hypothetical protein VGC86_15655 [Afipia sp.]
MAGKDVAGKDMAGEEMAGKDMATGNRESARAAGPIPWHPTHAYIVPNPKVTIDPIWQHYPHGNTPKLSASALHLEAPLKRSAGSGDLIYLILSY